MFAVVKEDKPLYLGDDRDRAITTFENNPGSMLTHLNSMDELASFLGEPHSCQGACCQHDDGDEHDFDGPTPEEVDEFIKEGLETIKAYGSRIADTIWANLERAGVSKEEVTQAWDKAKAEARKAAAEAELSGKEGLAALGDLLIKVGKSLVDRSK